ncbi:MAG TPA: hypothetical protein VFQ43_18870, partial [Nitrososphaera sp.]|nr:hypothetical protein [Nitrososphaera sp.]
ELENALFTVIDWQQAARGRKESETELRDDFAGMAVGDAMLGTTAAGAGGNYAALSKEIKGILCQ